MDPDGLIALSPCYQEKLKPYFPDHDLSKIDVIAGVPFFARAGVDAMTFGNTIYIDPARAGNLSLLAHEIQHSTQYAKNGFAGFLFNYGTSWAGNMLGGMNFDDAYKNIPYERDAFDRGTAVANDFSGQGGACGCR